MRFLWFWTFWHWSRESFRHGALLRGPLHGIGSHWDEWFRHEASPEDLQAIFRISDSGALQAAFVEWLREVFVPEALRPDYPAVTAFVLSQLAANEPFRRWEAFAAHRAGYDAPGFAAVVIGEGSEGEAEDVRPMEAIALPVEPGADTIRVVPEGFSADGAELESARQAALSLFAGSGFRRLLVRWMIHGERKGGRRMTAGGRLAWLVVAGLLGILLLAPDPGARLGAIATVLLVLWGGLGVASLSLTLSAVVPAWRQGRRLRRTLEHSRIHLRMKNGLQLKGQSAGLPICLNILLATMRAAPGEVAQSSLWTSLFRRIEKNAHRWAATGQVLPDGALESVVLGPKARACSRHGAIDRLLVPPRPADAPERRSKRIPENEGVRLQQAASVAEALSGLGAAGMRWRAPSRAFAVAVSLVVVAGLDDLWRLSRPPPAPFVVGPGSRSPYSLWVNLATDDADAFRVVFHSRYWANRLPAIEPPAANHAWPRAVVHLTRLGELHTFDPLDGNVSIERRRAFLGREFAPGERVGQFTFAYLVDLPHE